MKKIFGSYTLKDVLIDLVYTIIGTALVGFALSMFTVPNDIAPGGVSGLATALAYLTPIRVSVWALMMNIPLMIAAWRKLGARALFFTLISTLLRSLFIEIGDRFLPQYTSDTLVASLMGGVVMGLGMGMLFIRGISTGGTDLLALILKKLIPNLPAGTLLTVIGVYEAGSSKADQTDRFLCETEDGRYIEVENNNALEPVSSSGLTAAVRSAVRMRTAPGDDTEVIRQLKAKTKVEVLLRGEVWTLVKYKDETGYVMSRYLSFP